MIACAIALLSAAQASPARSAAPQSIRACVERNLPRYSPPQSAVAAQYSDIETTCRAALDDPTVSVQLTPEGGTTDQGGSTPSADPRPSGSGTTRTSGQPDPDSSGGARRTTSRDRSTAQPGASSSPPSAELVGRAVERSGPRAEDPLPTSLAGAPRWLVILLGGVARQAAVRGDLTTALAQACKARTLNPQDPDAWRIEADLLADLDRPWAADEAFSEAVRRSPHDWQTFADWSAALAREGDAVAARRAAERAATLNPLEPRPRYILQSLGPR